MNNLLPRLATLFRHTVVSLIVFGPIVGMVVGAFLLQQVPQHLVGAFALLFAIRYLIKMLSISFVHRGTVHDGFKAHPLVTALYLLAYSTNMQGPVINWAQTHRVHHAHADKPGDPHSPLEGFWHAHFMWLFSFPFIRDIKAPYTRPDHAMTRFFHYTYVVWLALDAFAMYYLFGYAGVVWLWLLCNGLVNQVTYCVNSVCHIWGERAYDTPDLSRNNRILALFTPEAWHNNHHMNLRLAYHGRGWKPYREFDLTYWILCKLEKCKLVWGIQRGESSTT